MTADLLYIDENTNDEDEKAEYVFEDPENGIWYVIIGHLEEIKKDRPYDVYIGRHPQEITWEEKQLHNCSVGMHHGKSCECGYHKKPKWKRRNEKNAEKQEIEYLNKTYESIHAGTEGTIQKRTDQGDWENCDDEDIDYYSCLLFKNGRHIPIPILTNAFRKNSVMWNDLNTQERIIRANINLFSNTLIAKLIKI